MIVNTCGFIDAAVEESLTAISEALAENGRVVACGCLGGRTDADGGNFIAKRLPKVLGVTGPDSVDEVIAMVEAHLPRPHDPWDDLVPAAGVRLTLQALRVPEDQRRVQPSLQLLRDPEPEGHPREPSDRRDRPRGGKPKEAGVKELLVISQDTASTASTRSTSSTSRAGARRGRVCWSLQRSWGASTFDAPSLRLPVPVGGRHRAL